MNRFLILSSCFCLLFLAGCSSPEESGTAQEPVEELAYKLPSMNQLESLINGDAVEGVTLETDGIKVALSAYGARLVSLLVKDREDQWVDIVLGFNEIETYSEQGALYYGATVGRYGNRIANGKFRINEDGFYNPPNNGPNSLHGGTEGFSQKIWDIREVSEKSVTFTRVSPDGEMGFPGNLTASVTYSIEEGGVLTIDYEATTDAPTVVNLTNHSYFNLNGEGSGTINNHVLEIAASAYTPVDETLIPTGELAPVEGTPFDFTSPIAIGDRVEEENEQLTFGNGYDHNFVLDAGLTDDYHSAATVYGDQTGIQMDILTTEPGLQFYGGNFMDGAFTGKTERAYGFRSGFCLETQHFPDSPNQPEWPSTVLLPGETYKTSTLHKFSARR